LIVAKKFARHPSNKLDGTIVVLGKLAVALFPDLPNANPSQYIWDRYDNCVMINVFSRFPSEDSEKPSQLDFQMFLLICHGCFKHNLDGHMYQVLVKI
jgi:hypothetical protein